MNVLICGGSGFLGHALAKSLMTDGSHVYILTRGRRVIAGAQAVNWDAKTTNGWGHLIPQMDVVIHLAGKSLSTWPWTRANKQAFHDSRIMPGRLLAQAIREAEPRPRLFVQTSGIGYYGLHGEPADESTPPGDDFLAQLAVQWEDATKTLDDLGVRRVILRTAPVLGKGGLLPLMALPVRLFFGGPLGSGEQALPWIHINDWVGAARHLMADETARGAYNLIAPAPVSNAEFNKTLAEVLRRPYWFPTPAFLLRNVLGEMSVTVLEGRFATPKRLLESGYEYQFPRLKEALVDLLA